MFVLSFMKIFLSVPCILMYNRWSCPPSEFQWIYGSKETCYILEGKVKIIVKDESVEIVAGDLVVFPKGLSCTWDILVAVDKHFSYA